MKRSNIKLFVFLAAALSLVISAESSARDERESWTSVQSQNFLVVGVAREKDLRRVASRLEEYRAVFSRLLSVEHFDASVPTTVVVFRDDRAYQPFKPLYRGQTAAFVSGYFQPGAEVNYVTLALDSDGGRGASSTLLHEYTHLLVNNYFRNAPLWLKEGLAEFYSTARISGDRRRVTLGAQIPHRARSLRGRALLPLRTLFAVDQQSPHYQEPDKRGLFYAESWALVHYLLEGGGGARRTQLARFVASLADGKNADESFRLAFQTDVDTLEAELSTYVRLASYPESSETFERPLAFDSQLVARMLTEAEGLAYLGDLLLHTDRPEEAENYLSRAIQSDARLARARVSLGILRLRQNRFAEAREQLGLAVRADPRNHLARYYFADALNREGASTDSNKITIKDFEERTNQMRAELRRAVEIAPGFVESYRLLATIEMERGDRLEEAEALLHRALRLAPRRLDLTLLLAQAHLMKGEFDAARRLAEPIARRDGDSHMRVQAEMLLRRVDAREEMLVRLKSQADEAARLEASESTPVQPCDMPFRGGPQQKRLRFAGEQTCGRLVDIECADDSVMLGVEAGGRTLKLRAADLKAIRFVTYTTAVRTGQLSCGVREPSNLVLVTYRAKRDGAKDCDGEALAVEFIPEDWNR
ncbi:MAG TPA: tetratricopeptide repeat protein [Pyrinomonadaceae bacterium]|nr:tetratricopeptide repeat protein [Pyrinomonadaceae bacterium]